MSTGDLFPLTDRQLSELRKIQGGGRCTHGAILKALERRDLVRLYGGVIRVSARGADLLRVLDSLAPARARRAGLAEVAP